MSQNEHSGHVFPILCKDKLFFFNKKITIKKCHPHLFYPLHNIPKKNKYPPIKSARACVYACARSYYIRVDRIHNNLHSFCAGCYAWGLGLRMG